MKALFFVLLFSFAAPAGAEGLKGGQLLRTVETKGRTISVSYVWKIPKHDHVFVSVFTRADNRPAGGYVKECRICGKRVSKEEFK